MQVLFIVLAGMFAQAEHAGILTIEIQEDKNYTVTVDRYGDDQSIHTDIRPDQWVQLVEVFNVGSYFKTPKARRLWGSFISGDNAKKTQSNLQEVLEHISPSNKGQAQ